MRMQIILVLLTLAQTAAALEVNGIAEYQTLGQSHYIATFLVAERSAEVDPLLDPGMPKRLELLINEPAMKPRWFSREWSQGVVINAPYLLPDEAVEDDPLDIFFQLISRSSGFILQAGDLITLDFSRELGTTVSLNNIVFINSPDEVLFNAILQVLIGPIPPSTLFKDRLLGLISDAQTKRLLKQREMHRVSSQRQREAQQYYLSTRSPKKSTATGTAVIAITQAATTAGNKSTPAAEVQFQSITTAIDPEIILTIRPPTMPPAGLEAKNTGGREALLASAKKEATLRQHIIEYENRARSLIVTRAAYPARDYDQGREGKVRLLVTILSTGKIKKVKTIEKARSRDMNLEARSAAKRAKLPPFPDTISTSEINMSIVIAFKKT